MNDGQFAEILTRIKAVIDTVEPDKERKNRLDIYMPGEPYLMSQYAVYTPTMCSDGLVDYSGVFPLSYNNRVKYSTVGYQPAINANTKNKEVAFDFIRFMISDEMMISPEQLFCTVNRNAVEKKAILGYESTVAGGYAPEGFTDGNLKKNLTFFDEMAEKLTTPEYTDITITDFLYEDLGEFFQGSISADETCNRLQSKLSMYLNE
jgi:multiple sugar transport system substrate-binding protein